MDLTKHCESLQRFPKDASRKLALQMKKQKVTFEEKIQKVIQDQNEDLSKTVTLMSFKNPDIQSQVCIFMSVFFMWKVRF